MWAEQLRRQGIIPRGLSLGSDARIPDNTSALVIAGPRVEMLPGEVQIIREWVERGGNLLWLMDPDEDSGLGLLETDLGVQRVPGIIVDPTTQLFGIDQPDMAIVSAYPFHPITQDFDLLTVFPQAAGLEHAEDSAFMALLRRFLSNLIPQCFHLQGLDGSNQAEMKVRFNPFVYKLSVTIDPAATIDPRLVLATGVLLAAIEGRQQN